MTLAGIVGLALGGVDIQRPDLDVFFALDEGLDELPSTRGGSDLIPFRHGRLPTARFADVRRPVLNGWITGGATSAMTIEYRTYVDAVKRVLDPTRKESLPLVATLEDGTIRWLDVRVANVMSGEVIASGARLMSIELEALDPFWYSTFGTLILDDGYVLDDGWTLDSSREVVITPTSDPYDFTLDVFGTTDIGRVRATIESPSVGALILRNMVDGDPIGFNFPALGGGALPLVVDNDARTVMQGTTSSRNSLGLEAGNAHGEYLRLRPGTNTLRLYGQPASLRLHFFPTWL